MTFRRLLLLVALPCLLPLVAARGQDAPPSAAGVKSRAGVERYAADAVRFLNDHQDDPRSPGVALEMLAVAEWGNWSQGVRGARTYLLLFAPRSPHALLAAKEFGGATEYADFVVGALQTQLGSDVPPPLAAYRFLSSLYPGSKVYDARLFDSQRLAVTADVLARWLLAEHRQQLSPATVNLAESLLAKLGPAVDELVARVKAQPDVYTADWARAAAVFRDSSLDPAARAERLAEMAAGDDPVPWEAVDLAAMVLPPDDASPRLARLRADVAVAAGRWRQADGLAQSILERRDAVGDLAEIRRWRALASSVIDAERAGLADFKVADDAAALLGQDADDPASAELLAALRDPASAAHAEAYARSREAMAQATWAEAEVRVDSADRGIKQIYAYDALDPQTPGGRRSYLALADADGLASAFRVGPDGAELWTRNGGKVVAPGSDVGLAYSATLAPVRPSGPDGSFNINAVDDGGGLVAVVREWGADARFAAGKGELPSILGDLAAAGLFPTSGTDGDVKTLSWATAKGRPCLVLRLDADGRVGGLGNLSLGDRTATVPVLRYGGGEIAEATVPDWAKMPDVPPRRLDAPLTGLELVNLFGGLMPDVQSALSSLASPATTRPTAP